MTDFVIVIYNNIAINGNFKLIAYTEKDFATPALHILEYKEFP